MTIATSFEPITPEKYFADPCEMVSLNASTAKVICAQSPQHAYAQHVRLGGQERAATKAMNEGKLLEKLLLGTGPVFAICDFKNWATNASKEAKQDAIDEGEVPVLKRDHDKLVAAVESAKLQLVEHGIELNGDSEMCALWGERSTGAPGVNNVQCRALMDHVVVSDGFATIWDLKKIHSCHPDDIEKQVENLYYGIQAVAYVRGLEENMPELCGRVRFRWLFISPGETTVVVPAQPLGECIAMGERRWRRAVDTWAECMRTGHWPSYVEPGQVLGVGVPRYAMYKEGLLP